MSSLQRDNPAITRGRIVELLVLEKNWEGSGG